MLRDYMKRNPQFLAGVSYFQEGVMLMRMGHHAQATEVLELALAEQQGLQRRHPDDPEPYRMAGQALTLLDRPKEAEQVFLDAIAKDRARLDRASDAATKPWIHFSLGATLLAMGNPAAASIEFSRARSLAPDQESRKKMDRVMKRWAEKNVVAE